jgi:hypothetical protein
VSAPLFILGVSRSGTTMLRVIVDRSPGIAIPDESFFVPLLARRHRGVVDPERFIDDVSRIPTISEWGVAPADVAARLRPGLTTGEAIAAVYEAYAAMVAKPRWGDKTPMYMRHLPLLERLFPRAQYVHLVRDGRDAALSFLDMPEGTFTGTWAHPRSAADFACLWRSEVSDVKALGRRVGPARYTEVRYETLVAAPEDVVRKVCAFAAIPFEDGMLEYAGAVDVAAKPHQQRLRQRPTVGVRSWRDEMPAVDVAAFEDVAGDLLADLGYEVTTQHRSSVRARLRRSSYAVRLAAWNASASALQRSALWRRRHPRL